MIFGKTKKEDELEAEDRPLESAAINRWRSLSGSSQSNNQTNPSEPKVPMNLEDQKNQEVENIQVISLDQVFEEDETRVIRLPEDRDELDLEEKLFNYHSQAPEEEEFRHELTDEEFEPEVNEDIEPLQASIEIEETVHIPKVPAKPPLEKANFDISSEQDLKNRFGDNIQSALGAGTMIEGRFSFETPVRIDGSMRGEIKSSSALIVGKNATVNANIKVGALIILGSVEGEIEADDLIEIRSSGTLLGDVLTKRIALEEGGVFSGSCTMVD